MAAVRLGRCLRASGLEVPVSSTIAFAAALDVVDVSRPVQVRAAATASFLRRPEDIAAFDSGFARWLGAAGTAGAPPPPGVHALVPPAVDEGSGTAAAPRAVRWSTAELLRDKDLAACSTEERAEVHAAILALRMRAPRRAGRRLVAAPRGAPDLRRTVRASVTLGGDPAPLLLRRQGTRARRLVLLLDVSGSMEPYAAAMLRFAHAAVVARRRVEVFALGTRFTRLTRLLASRDPDAALRAATTAMPDWAGGTRLGASLRSCNDRWNVPGAARGATVVVVSDGWDRGEASVLGSEMARLRRVAHRILWVNPLKASPGFEPTAAGMAAALPHVDELLEGHALGSLEALAQVVGS